jgi:hypothetical protein
MEAPRHELRERQRDRDRDAEATAVERERESLNPPEATLKVVVLERICKLQRVRLRHHPTRDRSQLHRLCFFHRRTNTNTERGTPTRGGTENGCP